MKTRLLSLITLFGSLALNAQTVSDFENLTLSTDTFWDGSVTPGKNTFTSGNAVFHNEYTPGQYAYWSGGFAYSNMKDTITSGYTNPYSARTAIGYNNSVNYVVAQTGSSVVLTGVSKGKMVSGFYVTNTTYAALSMQNGDWVAKKFGGVSGTDADWFKLTIKGFNNNVQSQDTVDFYLADFRFSNSSEDYILKNWQWVDLTSLGNVDSLTFSLTSSDNGQYGMNTPASFAMDNFTTADQGVGVSEWNSSTISIYPNPSKDVVNINFSSEGINTVTLFDASGRVIEAQSTNSLKVAFDVSSLAAGIYYINVNGATEKLIKN